MYKRIEAMGSTLLILLWFLGCQIFVVNLFKLILGQQEQSFLNYYDQHMYLINVCIQIICLVGVLLWDFFRHYQPLDFYKYFRKEKIILYIGYGILLWLGTSLFNLLWIAYFPKYSTEIEQLFLNKEVLLRFLALVVFAPLVEEYVFRGKIQKILKGGFGRVGAVILQGLLFGMIHNFALQKIYASLLGIVLGMVREKEDNLQSSTIMHMTINLIGFIIGTVATL